LSKQTPSRQITPSTTLDNLRKEAKRWLKALRERDPEAQARFARAYPSVPAEPTLRHVQHAIAWEHGLSGWMALKDRLAARTQDSAPMKRYERVAEALVIAFGTGEQDAMRIVWDYFGHMRAWDAMKRYVRLDLGKTENLQPGEIDEITLAEARFLVARGQGFESWQALMEFAASIPPDTTTFAPKGVAMYTIDESGAPQMAASSRDWDEVLAVMRERRLPGLRAHGQMTDALLERFTRIESITMLDLDGSRALTDEGLRYLARLPRLRRLNLAGCAITDRGLEVLRHLRALESVALCWTSIADQGAAHLAHCDELREVDLGGTATGDGAIRALAGKRHLHDFRSGNAVSNAGIALLHDLPIFKIWHGGDVRLGLTSFDARPNFLLLRGTFTDEGLAQLVGLDGLFALNVDNDRLAITGAGLAPLAHLPHLGMLGFDAKDDAMPFIAALPHLRFLMCQDTTAGDDGFVALSKSQSIEYIWGRRCYNLQRRGFTALADMPRLRALSVSCKNVDDEGVSALPRFPALRELMPMDVPDAGYRHIGRCEQLQSLVLMYCRDTSDAATEHLAGLTKLERYFASYTRVTDRTPEILSGVSSLQDVTFDGCAGLTNAGITALARLPRLQYLRVASMPHVTGEVAAAFPARVNVSYAA
jgi:hypothetical protein